MAQEKVDVVIVGAGAAGCLFAAKLAEAGRAVTVLEAGPAWTTDDLVSSQIWSRRLRWGGPVAEVGGRDPCGVVFNSGWGYGGAALHHYGTWPRMMPSDFTMRRDHGRGLDWPFDYGTLRPYYDRIQREVGMSGDAEAEIWRPAGDPYPLPPLEIFAQARRIAKGFEALGMRTAPSPMAILSREYQGRSPCIYDGWCDAGCPTGALANPLVTYMPIARQHGAVFRPHAYVTRLKFDRAGTRIEGVEYIDARGEAHVQHADVVVLAASTVQNPTILLNSVSAGHPQGVGNRNGLVGAYFMTHAIAPIYGFFDDEETENYLGVSGAQLTNMDYYPKDRNGDGAFGSIQWQVAPTLKPNDLLGVATARADIIGPDLDRFMKRAVHHLAAMYGFCEDLPLRDNRVELGGRSGPGGTRLARVVHGFSEESRRLWQAAIKAGRHIVEASGAANVWSGPMATAHMMGGTVMGRDPAHSVTDGFGRVHDCRNLIVAGPGLFPTCGAMNPNFTNHAVSLRAVEHLIAHWGDHI